MSITTHNNGSRKPFTSQIVARGAYGAATLAANVILTALSAQVLALNPGGASRNVTLPPIEDGLSFTIKHSGTVPADVLVVKNPAGTTLATLVLGQEAVFWSDAAAWVAYSVKSTVGSASGLLVASGTIATAAVKTLRATPVTLVAAPGATSYVDVVDCHWFLDFGTVAYDSAAAGDTLGAKYTNGSGAACLDLVAGNAIGAAAADYHALVRAVPEVIPVINAPVVAHLDLSEWFAAAGDSPLKYELTYRIRTFDLA